MHSVHKVLTRLQEATVFPFAGLIGHDKTKGVLLTPVEANGKRGYWRRLPSTGYGYAIKEVVLPSAGYGL